ncbi:Very-long-chain (3R)-3-hydroxyacyl-CoA dehydratase [Pseudolycoriella hygida]|uniref:Very-long-chain (3R)-3-hydroxyacyl-CoA dehydratase n=1 Tax=Pseudolycoriella hygida TaxID=35572 RepID=A0A9Q0RXW2_9DIPT|nr:Very-long-chain (3R)-3-hydroxyacyl-CoA dehydratase [Pseudolycoriella hygida]
MSNLPSPFVYWAQTENQVTLKVDLKDAKDANIELMDKSISFKGHGIAACGYNQYSFHIDLYSDVDTETSKFKILDSKVSITLQKKVDTWWPRITSQPQKPQWLKIDFDRWRCDPEDDVEEDESRNVMNDYPGLYERLQKEEIGYRKEQTKTVYLILYNLIQFIGFLYIFIVMSIRFYRDGHDSMKGTYETVGNAFKFIQILQYLEVMHPLFGYTKGDAVMPFIQVTGRNFILFVMINAEERMQTKPVIFYLFMIWSGIELVRYPYYITSLMKKNIGLLTWLRYSLWIPLYPLGILCEGIIILRNIPYFEETNRFTVQMPNKWNATFDMVLFMKIYLIILILPGAYFMMNEMRKTRTKKLRVKKNWKKN